ncbi:ABC transporter substrate-binding protein [Paenibacillus lemnae]|uniref:Carbohydrate ABC transporter substrate-binding protein n=1 Tax=Paenibacillus lemnae TaxID=1330551 RepID=A0A848M5F7_PAELE|nr:ABC transporter substrate-binding protein [Paenibacillus lemnae]NMO95460.1 carbohydrate ABC transporter substrate-binding protein [Paenibacillus lemnae]
MRRCYRCVVFLLLAAIIMSGCVGQQGDLSNTIQEPVTLKISWWGSQIRHDATIQVIEMYEEQYPHIQIEYDYSSFNEYWKKLAPMAAGNALPDIIQMDVSYLSLYTSLELIDDLSPYIRSGMIDTQDVKDQFLSGGKVHGNLFGIPLGVNALNGVYDPEVFIAHGIEPPDQDWTWDDFEAMGESLRGKGVYLGTQFTPEQFFAYYLRQHGETMFAADGASLGYEDDGLFIDFFGRLQRLAQQQLIYAPDIWTSNSIKPNADPFYEGKALFNWGYSNQFIGKAESNGSRLKIIPLPGPNSDKGLFLKPSMLFSISKNSTHKEEAAKFISFFINNIEANKLMKGERGIPISSKVTEALSSGLDADFAEISDYIAWVAGHSSPMDPPDPPGTADVTVILRELNDLLLFDKISPETAALQFRQQANQILARNKHDF